MDPLFAGMLTALITALVAAASTWFVAKRKAGGTVKTSEASEIWTANRELREMLIKEAATRTAENELLRKEAEARRKEAEECHRQNAEILRRTEKLQQENDEIRQELIEMTRTITELK